jgi:hypothetical protein
VHADRVHIILHCVFDGVNQWDEVLINNPKQYRLRALLVLDWILKFRNPQDQVEILIEG